MPVRWESEVVALVLASNHNLNHCCLTPGGLMLPYTSTKFDKILYQCPRILIRDNRRNGRADAYAKGEIRV